MFAPTVVRPPYNPLRFAATPIFPPVEYNSLATLENGIEVIPSDARVPSIDYKVPPKEVTAVPISPAGLVIFETFLPSSMRPCEYPSISLAIDLECIAIWETYTAPVCYVVGAIMYAAASEFPALLNDYCTL